MRALLLTLIFAAAAVFPAGAEPAAGARLAEAALAQVGRTLVYDPSYVALDYPGGDISEERGVCADVVVRTLREIGIDLQLLVHEDMNRDFAAYPDHWGLDRPDPNIDHRRVPNLEAFFRRAGVALPASGDPSDYAPGDVVAWNLRGPSGFLPHIGVVTGRRAPSGRPLVVHNIGAGARLEDALFDWPITGRYRPALMTESES
ncbi:DUF1287 domain-containing protein [Amphiplicatus metriothermophilus]|uniref:DUF1287 domain-containing protein n=1 Tax=Amphiplicatus metriothermophilus TaxID=1519374 RepID=A0A239PIA6_9PROT|nr:DUF1287 domain-containing protein [Amphiplicatus metriothermophilus]MBB5518150.1 hypothetical protein [Amphiplicatus metriothermophilus]SNT67516.1 hypothetical protein SAMN06297382_0004 [Amphiplicatus metriothermophilus]